MLDDKRYVWFGGKPYYTTARRLTELMQQAVHEAMPEDFTINFIQTSNTSESMYFSILQGQRLFSFRISSHRQRGSQLKVKTFLTTKYQNFSGLKEALRDYFASDGGCKILPTHLAMLAINAHEDYKIKSSGGQYIIVSGGHVVAAPKERVTHLVRSLLSEGLLFSEEESDVINSSFAGESLLAQANNVLPLNLAPSFTNPEFNFKELDARTLLKIIEFSSLKKSRSFVFSDEEIKKIFPGNIEQMRLGIGLSERVEGEGE